MSVWRYNGTSWTAVPPAKRWNGSSWSTVSGKRRTADGWEPLWDGGQYTGGGPRASVSAPGETENTLTGGMTITVSSAEQA